MLETVFLQVLNMSVTGGMVILFVLIARLLLKKAPKIFSYALWSVVLFRLCCPFSFESAMSLLPYKTGITPAGILYTQTPGVDLGLPAVSAAINAAMPVPNLGDSVNPMQIVVAIAAAIWLVGIAVLLIYSVLSLLKLRRRLGDAVHESGNIYTSPSLTSPFVMGLFSPKIYLPASLTAREKDYILLHEQTHIKRLDHAVKLFCFFVLCVHWFNPLVWVAFFLCGRDMELSCDEAVIKKLGSDVKKDYSTSLLTLATGRRIVGGTPLAFGEGDTKSRIKNVLNYKKPAFWVIVVSVIAVVAVGIGLMANPKESDVTDAAQLDYFVMTDEVDAIGCEYAVNKDHQLDTLQMLSALEKLNGFNFDTDWASHGYVKFVFNDKKPKNIFLRYCANVDDIWQQEYPIDPINYKIKVPPKIGIYNFFADITWENGEQETAYFCVTVASNATHPTITINGRRYFYTSREKLKSKPYNATILKIDAEGQTMVVEGIDQNSAIGDNCILDWSNATLQIVEADGSIKTLSIDDFATGDYVVLFVDEIQETYPTKAAASTVQLRPRGASQLVDLRPMIMINGILYLDTGKESPMGGSSAVSGTIKSTVSEDKKPTEHEQSNFGFVGSKYADGGDFIQVNIDGKWIVFEKETDDTAPDVQPESTHYLQSLTDEERKQTEEVVRAYFTDEAPYYEGVVSMEPMPNESVLYQNTGIEAEYAPGNIIIYKVLTGRDQRDNTPERSASVARASKDAPWTLINQGY